MFELPRQQQQASLQRRRGCSAAETNYRTVGVGNPAEVPASITVIAINDQYGFPLESKRTVGPGPLKVLIASVRRRYRHDADGIEGYPLPELFGTRLILEIRPGLNKEEKNYDDRDDCDRATFPGELQLLR